MPPGVCRYAKPQARTEGFRCWLWHRWRRLLHGKGNRSGGYLSFLGKYTLIKLTNRRKIIALWSGSTWLGPFGEHGEHCHGEGHRGEAAISTSEFPSNVIAEVGDSFPSLIKLPCVLSQVQFEVADATKRMFSECSFDVIYSRDTILHIDNKPALFKRFHVSIS